MRTLKRRRREYKTDYKLRLSLLKSEKPRLVVRKTNKYIIIQVIESEEAKDKVLAGITSKELLENGWDKKFAGSLKSLPAAYLSGLLMAKKIKEKLKKPQVILDIGMTRHVKGSRMYAAAKGIIDGGVELNMSESVCPSKERLNGDHLDKNVAEMVKKI